MIKMKFEVLTVVVMKICVARIVFFRLHTSMFKKVEFSGAINLGLDMTQ
jgi:hypothetical protein